MNLEENKVVHPFFSKPLRNPSPAPQPPVNETPIDGDDDLVYPQAATEGQPAKRRKRTATKSDDLKAKGQTSSERFTGKASGVVDAHQEDDAENGMPGLEADPNMDRRKRRKTASPPASDEQHVPKEVEPEVDAVTKPSIEETVLIEGEGEDHTTPPATGTLRRVRTRVASEALDQDSAAPESTSDTAQVKKTTPKKILKVSKNGKLLSPTSIKPAPEVPPSPRKKRGRKPKQKLSPTTTIIKYGSDAQSRQILGQKIDDILERKRSRAPRKPLVKPPTKPAGPPKPTHPFFRGKPAPTKEEIVPNKEVKVAPAPRTPRKSAATPGKLRMERRALQSPKSMPAFGPLAGDSRAPKKMKNIVPTVPQEEDLISRLAEQLKPSIARSVNSTSNDAEYVRLPTRILTTGIDIQGRVHRELRTLNTPHRVHPAVTALLNDIENTLTPFDKGECETQTWTQKYAPCSAAHALQPGKEVRVLRDWLESLTIKAVESRKDGLKLVGPPDIKPPKKKRRKIEDDFIVSSNEDEDEDLLEFSDGDEYGPNVLRSGLKSMKRPRTSRSKNVVVMSGPSGCGKSAAIYAVAKELGFDVFEINSSSRRSGKDILDKVGDMSENHLVNQKRDVLQVEKDATTGEDTDVERMSKAFQKDLESGRQGTMKSFFTSTPLPAAKPVPEPKSNDIGLSRAVSTAQNTLPTAKAPRKAQKQSLILFEEADVLFEEDQQFWSQVIRLAAQSKRPIIITCNNESLIPVYDLPLGAILRLSPPPVDLATDYMLALAAREGHILERKAVCDLFKSKNHDLRASITDLDFWCQMSVGDKKGGLEWIYQRWPAGKDVDEHGRVVRVASEGTYQSGMGMLPHDISATVSNCGFDKEEELLNDIWVNWGLNPNKLTKSLLEESSSSTLKDLEHLDSLLALTSAADIYCHIGLPSYDRDFDQPVDPSLPPMSAKDRLNYTEAAPVMQVDHVSDFASLNTSLYVQTHLNIQRAFGTSSLQDEDRRVKNEHDYATAILHYHTSRVPESLSRPDFSFAFDILAAPPSATLAFNTSYQLVPSSFDRTFRIVTEDLAPYVRAIVSHEQILDSERLRMGNLLSEGGRSKRPRTTRTSRVTMEGGRRETKRRDRWFDKNLNFYTVMGTAGKAWSGLGALAEQGEGSSRMDDSAVSAQEE
ncbi:P-loop containing nucleoside triphosphate hydrolase protein [Amniculicola lignicola CBS 123094]|uniref:P-loop containing nucleoside triphosphate hydrolase protein n=1 Tax=Amniculicola lignicola CBS 123094 TaxID=1392246 RepID=A0A6A5WRV8_9PLEO|nr:P-loop containing nucleoside triphosphate hydrolase protein [Amniculicola lignicola CBS 123094]